MKQPVLATLALGLFACAGAEVATVTAAPPAAPPAVVEIAPAPSAEPSAKPEDDVLAVLGSGEDGAFGADIGADGLGLGALAPDGGAGQGTLGGNHLRSKVTTGAASVDKGLPPDAVRHVARRSAGRFRFCYEKALMKDPNLAGKVLVKLTIEKDGAVSSATDAGSTLPDKDVVACVVRAFTALRFPPTEHGGRVVITYPIVFAPG